MYRPNEISATDPTVNDDFANGFRQGNGWLNTATGSYFVCEDDTTGAAVWTEITGSEISEWDDWTPTFLAYPSVSDPSLTYVTRYQQVGNRINFYFDVNGNNGTGATITSITMTPPVEIAKTDSWPTYAASINTSSKAPGPNNAWCLGLIDADSASGRKIYMTSISVINGNDYTITGEGFYEIT